MSKSTGVDLARVNSYLKKQSDEQNHLLQFFFLINKIVSLQSTIVRCSYSLAWYNSHRVNYSSWFKALENFLLPVLSHCLFFILILSQHFFYYSSFCGDACFPSLQFQNGTISFKGKDMTFLNFPSESQLLSFQSPFSVSPMSFFKSQCHATFIFISILLGW